MRRIRWSAMATIVVILVILCALAISFLPLFMQEVWPPLWDAALQPSSRPLRSFGAVGPWCHIVPWPLLLAIPLSSLMVVVPFVLIAAAALLRRRQ